MDHVKTKFGKDFYDLFFQQYYHFRINGTRPVIIEENFSYGRSTQIKVIINNKIIHQYFSRPGKEFNTEMVRQSLYKVVRFFQQEEKNREQSQKYQ